MSALAQNEDGPDFSEELLALYYRKYILFLLLKH